MRLARIFGERVSAKTPHLQEIEPLLPSLGLREMMGVRPRVFLSGCFLGAMVREGRRSASTRGLHHRQHNNDDDHHHWQLPIGRSQF